MHIYQQTPVISVATDFFSLMADTLKFLAAFRPSQKIAEKHNAYLWLKILTVHR